jgi:subtilase family serine protease
VSETACAGSNGGYSQSFSRPWYQDDFHSNRFRGSPDIASHADPNTGYTICFDNTCQRIGGKTDMKKFFK